MTSHYAYIAAPRRYSWSTTSRGMHKGAAQAIPLLVAGGLRIFCPALQFEGVDKALEVQKIPPMGERLALEASRPFLEGASLVLVVNSPKWEEDKLLKATVALAEKLEKPVVYLYADSFDRQDSE